METDLFNKVRNNSLIQLIYRKGWNSLIENIKKQFNLSKLIDAISSLKQIVLIFEDEKEEEQKEQEKKKRKRVFKVHLKSKNQKNKQNKGEIEQENNDLEIKEQETSVIDNECNPLFYKCLNQHEVVIQGKIILVTREFKYYWKTLEEYIKEKRQQKQEISNYFKKKYIVQMCSIAEYLIIKNSSLISIYPSIIYLTEDYDILLKQDQPIDKTSKYYYLPKEIEEEDRKFCYLFGQFNQETLSLGQKVEMAKQLKSGKALKNMILNQNTIFFSIAQQLIGYSGQSQIKAIAQLLNTILIQINSFNPQPSESSQLFYYYTIHSEQQEIAPVDQLLTDNNQFDQYLAEDQPINQSFTEKKTISQSLPEDQQINLSENKPINEQQLSEKKDSVCNQLNGNYLNQGEYKEQGNKEKRINNLDNEETNLKYEKEKLQVRKKQQKYIKAEVKQDVGYYKNRDNSIQRVVKEISKQRLTSLDLSFDKKVNVRKCCFFDVSFNDQILQICQILYNQRQLKSFCLSLNSPEIMSSNLQRITQRIKGNNNAIETIQFQLDNAYTLDVGLFYSLNDLCQQITKLKLTTKHSYFTSNHMKVLNQSFQNFNKLKLLDLDFSSSVQICEFGFQNIIAGIKNSHASLQELILNFSKNNNMRKEAFENFNINTNSMTKLKKLSLNFSSNKHFDSFVLLQIASFVLSNNKLQDFYLNLNSNNEVQDQGFNELLKNLSCCKELQKLEICLEKNKIITDTPFENLGEFSSKLESIKLNLAENSQVSDITIGCIAKIIIESHKLNTLHLNMATNNNITFNGICLLTDSLINKQDKSIQDIYLNFKSSSSVDNNWIACLFACLKGYTHLQSLDFDFNNITCLTNQCFTTFQGSMENLTELRKFKLSFEKSTHFTNDIFKWFAQGLKNCDYLEILSLNFSHSSLLNDDSLFYIGWIIQNMEKATKIEIVINQNNLFTDKGLELLMDNFENQNSTLEEFIIDFQEARYFTSSGIVEIFNNLKQQLNLRVLFLNFNHNSNFTDQVLKCMKTSFENLLRVSEVSLYFANSNFTQYGIKDFLTLLKELKSLAKFTIDLSSTKNLKDHSFTYFGQYLSSAKNLTSLNLALSDQLNFNDANLIELSKGLQKSGCVQHLRLDLSKNAVVSNLSLTFLSHALASCKYLRDLYLNLNKNQLIDQEGLILLSKGISKAVFIQSFELSMQMSTQIQDQGIISIAQSISNKQQLSSFKLDFSKLQQFNSNSFKELTCSLKNLESLQTIHLKFGSLQNIDNHLLNYLKIGLQNCKLLQDIVLDFNQSKYVNQNGIQNLFSNSNTMRNISSVELNLHGDSHLISLIQNQMKSSFRNALISVKSTSSYTENDQEVEQKKK